MSQACELLALQLRAERVKFEREWRFHPTRKWRFDFVFDAEDLLALEVDGGGFVQGRHSRGIGLEKDAEKLSEAAILGWRVLRVTPRHVKTGQALAWVKRAIEGRGNSQ